VLSVTSAQLEGWLATLIWPLTRILGVISAAPILGQTRIPLRVRLGLGIAIAIVVAPTLPGLPDVSPASAAGMLILATQLVIGLAIGFAVRLVFAAIEMAGDLAGMQMGLGFALFYDPANAQHSPVLGQFLGLVTALSFLALNGHLMMISALADSFRYLPISPDPLPGAAFEALARHGTIIFSAALRLALPIIITMLVVNLALGVLTRAAPQLNVFAVGFPITIAIGMSAMLLCLPYLAPILERLLEDSFRLIATLPAR